MSLGICRSASSSSVLLSVWWVGEVRIEAAEETGSKDATLERMEGIETRERVRKGHRGGRSGVGVTVVSSAGGCGLWPSLIDARGVSTSSVFSSTAGGVIGVGVFSLGVERGDFFSEPFLSLPLPRTAFRRELLRLRLLGRGCSETSVGVP